MKDWKMYNKENEKNRHRDFRFWAPKGARKAAHDLQGSPAAHGCWLRVLPPELPDLALLAALRQAVRQEVGKRGRGGSETRASPSSKRRARGARRLDRRGVDHVA